MERFRDEITPVDKFRDQDDHLRPNATLEGLAKAQASFRKRGIRHSGQCEWHSGWWRGGRRHDKGSSEVSAVGAYCELGNRWGTAGDYGNRSGPGYERSHCKRRD